MPTLYFARYKVSNMKKIMCYLLSVALLLTGCGCNKKITYESGMFTDVRDWDFYESAVALCVNEGYMTFEGDTFRVNEAVSLSECADIIVKITGAETDNPIKYVIDNRIAPYDFGEWDRPAARCEVAYMVAQVVKGGDINNVITGAICDTEGTFSENEIYTLYRKGIFSGDKTTNTFRPFESMTRAEMAIVVQRVCDMSKRVRFDMGTLSVSFVAFGDTIGHGPVLSAAKTNEGYDFTENFENMTAYIESADVACVNQETVFVGSNFTGYPSFGSPEAFGIAEAMAGFDVVTHATNHAFDRGEAGVLYTTAFWENYPQITMLGMHESYEDAEEISVIEKNGLKIALLNYTYSLNGYVLPKGKEYMVDLLDEEKIRADMEKARGMSDAIVVFAHWGNEYQNVPAQSQRSWAQLFADCGATVIVGAHPHVVQPLETVTANDGRVVPVYYSLGNFISNQNDYQTALCAMADFKIIKDSSGVKCTDYVIKPVVTHMQPDYYSAYLLEDYTEEMAKKHKHRGRYGQRFTKEKYIEVFNEIVN